MVILMGAVPSLPGSGENKLKLGPPRGSNGEDKRALFAHNPRGHNCPNFLKV